MYTDTKILNKVILNIPEMTRGKGITHTKTIKCTVSSDCQ